ncbi:MAG: flagellar hook-length control protein FliK, partial [Desulfotomaculum sp.]|nr:flagellar hook-length control protein FliK [Desulfotomaculum sp.]
QKASNEITALITALTKQQPKLAMQLPVNPLVSKITDRQRTDLSNPLNNTQPPVKAVAENLLLNNRVVTMSPDVRPVMDGSNAKAEIATLNQQLPATTTSSTTVATSFVAKEGLTTPAQLGERLLEMVKTVFVRQQPEQTTTVRLKLYPEHLGEVIVRLTYNLKTANSRGELSVQFYVANALAKDALENALPQLRETISQQLKLNDASIFNNQDGSRWQQDKPAGLAGREQQQGEEPLPDDDLAESGVWRDNEGVVTGLDQLV